MQPSLQPAPGLITETLRGIVDRVTYHNPDNGWSVLRVSPLDTPHQQETVIVHQTRVFAGATMTFQGSWTVHPRHGRQFMAATALERKPATQAALERYLGSGLIHGVGPKTARKIVQHFGAETLAVFEGAIERLTEVPGIARKKLAAIRTAWQEHRAIRDVMLFLQSHGISTLFAVRIYKAYGDRAIQIVSEDPYRLANDIYGIGFFSADKVALSFGLPVDSPQRITAAIKHVLAASRQFGHCYLTAAQIQTEVEALLGLSLGERLGSLLADMAAEGLVMVRSLRTPAGVQEACYYAKALYYDELYVAKRLAAMGPAPAVDPVRVRQWITTFCKTKALQLSDEQAAAIQGIVGHRFAILTGGPGCGKTTATRILVGLLTAMGRRVLLAAPTGRAAQRMLDVIGKEAKTIHRLLEWQQNGFKRNETHPLAVDFLIVDEGSMLDISLTADLLRAVPADAQVLFIGDADQLPSVGAGNVLRDIIDSQSVPCFRLTRIFRQAEQSLIVRYAHQINAGQLPPIDSPFKKPGLWHSGADCLFIDSDEATREQLGFVSRVKRFYGPQAAYPDDQAGDPYAFQVGEPLVRYGGELTIPRKFAHVDLEKVHHSKTQVEELRAVLKRVHPWSSLHYGLSAVEIVQKLYIEWIPKYLGKECETQILTPMVRGTLGAASLNALIQAKANPSAPGRHELTVGERIFRDGDRVIHRRNNYDLGVFNGDIGVIEQIDTVALTAVVAFPDGRNVLYQREDIVELELAYAITIHKSQGSEFAAVIIPVLGQHFKMLFRNLIYTGLTRARKMAVLTGTRKALAMAVANADTSRRQTALSQLLSDFHPSSAPDHWTKD